MKRFIILWVFSMTFLSSFAQCGIDRLPSVVLRIMPLNQASLLATTSTSTGSLYG